MTTVAFTVPGRPQPAGSKRAFKTKNGFSLVDTNQAQLRPWRTAIQQAAHDAYDGPLLEGPLLLEVHFVYCRPRSHFGTGRNSASVRPSAASWPASRPDTTKLLRGLEDALNGVLWRDDGQIVRQYATKVYGGRAQTEVLVQQLEAHR